MWNPPTKIQLSKLPKIYATDGVPCADKKVRIHFFINGSDWYAVEFDGEDQFFGYAILNGDTQNAEWGYFSLSELKRLKSGFVEVDREIHWKVKKASEIENIKC